MISQRTVEVPSRTSPEAADFADHVGRKLDAKGYGIPTGAILAMLEVVTELATGPRYEAVRTPFHDRLGDHSYAVIDNRTGRTVDAYRGRSAGQDARETARTMNGEEE